MRFKTLSKATIVAEPILRDDLIDAIVAMGAPGYTVTDALGAGGRDPRTAKRVAESVQIEVVCEPELARRLLEFAAGYSKRYACTAWATTVETVDVSRRATA